MERGDETAGRASLPAHRTPRLALAAIGLPLLVAAGLIGVGCDGSGQPASTPQGGIASGVDPEAALRRMVLTPSDLPPGLQQVDETVTTNEDLINASLDQASAREEIEAWGRLLGYESVIQPSFGASPELPLVALASSASLYETPTGASASFDDARVTMEETDWQADRPDFSQFQQRRIERQGVADELIWLRLSDADPDQNRVIVEDLIVFRIGIARGYLRVVAAAEGGDRNLLVDEVGGWLEQASQRMRDTLADGVQEGASAS